MKVKELVESYKQSQAEARAEHEDYMKKCDHDVAYLNSLDPAREVSPEIWNDYKPYQP